MFGLFGKSRFLDADLEPWCLDTWAWFMRNIGGLERIRATALATPTRDFFPPSDATGDARRTYLRLREKRHEHGDMGLRAGAL